MKFQKISVALFLAGKSIQRGNRFTFILTVTIMALVFVNLVFLPSIISGVVVNFNTQSIDYSFGNLIIEPREKQVVITNVYSLKRKLDQIPEVIGSSPRTQIGATYRYKDNTQSGPLIALSPKSDMEVTKIGTKVKEGYFLEDTDTDSIVLGTTLTGNQDSRLDKSDSLGGPQVGERISVTFSNGVTRDLVVKGILDSGVYNVDLAGYVTTREMEQVLGVKDEASSILVKMRENGKEEYYKNLLMQYGVQEKVRTYKEKAGGFVNDAVTAFEIINTISTGVSLVIATVVTFIVIFINTVNKRRQIGILKAIGINKRVIVYSYVLQVLVIATCGTILGLALAGLLVMYLNINPLIFPGGAVYPVVEPGPFIRSTISLYLVSIISGFIPSYNTANEPILEAIRGPA